MGPAPTRTSPPAHGEAEEPARSRLLKRLAARAGEPVTVGALVEAVGRHQNTTRHHLRTLTSAGLVEPVPLPPAGGRGRPSTGWVLTERGRDTTARPDAAAEEYVALAAAFADRLAQRGGDPGEDARAIGRAWGAGLAARHPGGQAAGDEGGSTSDAVGAVARLTGLLDRLGFSPEREDTGGESTGPALLLRTCPLLDTARRHPEVVCQVHLGLATGALEELGADPEGLRLRPFDRPGACVLALPARLGV